MSDRQPLTDRQRKVFETIRNYCADKGYPPSIRELMPMLGVSSLRGVTIHLDALERKGWIRRESTSRSIQILDQHNLNFIPVLGESNEAIELPPQLKGRAGEIIAVRVQDDAMQSDHVVTGDIVFVEMSSKPNDGDLVAAQSGGEIVVRRLDIDSGKLIASSMGHERRIDTAKILGSVKALIRLYGSDDQARITD